MLASTNRADMVEQNGETLMLIGDAAKSGDMAPGTLRTYDREGLLTPIRAANGTRLYTPQMVARAREIKAEREARFGAGRRHA
jgi:DNA-binding transcriptional MerR regulator